MERNPRILHVIDRLAPGGATTALVETARHLIASGQRHTILSLTPPVAAACAYAAQAGLKIEDEGLDTIDGADLVWVHAWASPALDAFLRRPHPPARWLVWLHVAGDTAPHMLTPALAGFADKLVASSPYTAALPVFAEANSADVVLSGGDLGNFATLPPRGDDGSVLRIGYIGTLDAAKMHRDFVALSRAADIPAARFDIYGRGADEARLAQEAGSDVRFRLHGWTSDVPTALATMDMFGYPLARNSYATAELVLQEAMAAAVPPVILAFGAAVHIVEHERTGLIARDEADYPRCLERLAGDPALRRRLGEAARRHALDAFGAARAARAFEPILAGLLARPKVARVWDDGAGTGADRFIAALGDAAAPFVASQEAVDNAVSRAADDWIAAAPPALASATAGGILHWRSFYPDDPWLRLWSGLVHRGRGRMVLALGEFLRARSLGLTSPRVERYISERG